LKGCDTHRSSGRAGTAPPEKLWVVQAYVCMTIH
jgi:hypothetical protein